MLLSSLCLKYLIMINWCLCRTSPIKRPYTCSQQRQFYCYAALKGECGRRRWSKHRGYPRQCRFDSQQNKSNITIISFYLYRQYFNVYLQERYKKQPEVYQQFLQILGSYQASVRNEVSLSFKQLIENNFSRMTVPNFMQMWFHCSRTIQSWSKSSKRFSQLFSTTQLWPKKRPRRNLKMERR